MPDDEDTKDIDARVHGDGCLVDNKLEPALCGI